MKRTDRALATALAGLLLSTGLPWALGDSPNNPYKVIYERNAFNLKDPPPPPAPPAPPEAKVNITFTGLARIGNIKRAYMMTPDAKQPGKFNYYDLAEGEKVDTIEVLEIDESKESVKVRNGSDEALLTFATHGLKGPVVPNAVPPPGTAPGSKPGMPPPPVPAVRNASSSPAASGPIIVGANNTAGSSPDYGKTPANPATSAGITPVANGGASRGASDGTGLRTIPSRSLRTQPAAPMSPNNVSAEEQLILMEAQRMKAAERGIPMPPTPGLPNLPLPNGQPNPQ